MVFGDDAPMKGGSQVAKLIDEHAQIHQRQDMLRRCITLHSAIAIRAQTMRKRPKRRPIQQNLLDESYGIPRRGITPRGTFGATPRNRKSHISCSP